MKMLYKNEIQFKKRLVEVLREAGYFVTPIQTRTVPGVPDLFVCGHGTRRWVEVKHSNAMYFKDRAQHYQIDFRAGQQAWAWSYYHATGESVYVVTAFADSVSVMLAGGSGIWPDNKIPSREFTNIWSQQHEWPRVDLRRLTQ